jgi:flavin-dependent dehydrogenase
MDTLHHVDVLVVGAGPTGLLAAGDLARAGHSVSVLERWGSTNPSSRAFVTMPRTLEVLDTRGLADDLIHAAHRTPGVEIFGGARIDLTNLRSRYRFAAITPQTNVDRILGCYAVGQGADVRRGMEVIGLCQDAEGVTVTAQPKDHDDPAPLGLAGLLRHRGRRRAQHHPPPRRRRLPRKDDPVIDRAGRRQAAARPHRGQVDPRQHP